MFFGVLFTASVLFSGSAAILKLEFDTVTAWSGAAELRDGDKLRPDRQFEPPKADPVG
jgi:hypothetical protein